jgi:uncharacterized repeat protein (TIGR03803 family)
MSDIAMLRQQWLAEIAQPDEIREGAPHLWHRRGRHYAGGRTGPGYKGNLYGTTYQGGAYNYGTVFKVTKKGVEQVLYSFSGGADGRYPVSNLIRDAAGNLYGTTAYGGIQDCAYGDGGGCGTVFMLTP